MNKKEYWVFIPQEKGGYSAKRFFSKSKAKKYKDKFKKACIKEI